MTERSIALVSGATGFIGSNLVKALIARGQAVFVLAREGTDTTGAETVGAKVIRNTGGTLELVKALSALQPQTVFHLASYFTADHKPAEVDSLINSNLGFSTQLLEASVLAGCKKFVNAGTNWQHYDSQNYSPACLYAATKEAFEAILRYYSDASGLRVLTLKLFDSYGPNDSRRKLLALLSEALRTGQPLGMSPGEQKINFVHVDDIVRAFLHAEAMLEQMSLGSMRSFAVRSDEDFTLRELVSLLGEITGKTLAIRFGDRPYRAREVMTPWKGEVLPGWRPEISLENGLRCLFGNGNV